MTTVEPVQESVRVVVVEDSALLRGLLVETLHQTPGVSVVGAYGTCGEAREDAVRREPQAVLLDLRLPDGDGLQLGLDLQSRIPGLRVIVVSDLADSALLLAVPEPRRRSWSYLLKGSLGSSAELGTAVRMAVREGRSHVDPAVSPTATAGEPSWFTRLSARQRQILELVSVGQSNQAIAETLGISASTVEYHLTAIYQALDVPSDGSVNPRVVCARMWGEAAAERRTRA